MEQTHDFYLDLTADQHDELDQLMVTRGTRTQQEVVEQAFALGLSQLVYRTKRNKNVWAQQKADREELEQLRAMLKK